MESVTVWRGATYRHVERPTPVGPLACPACGTRRVAFHSWRRRVVEHVDAERPTYLVLKLAKYACREPACARRYFTPAVAEAATRARTSRRLQATAVRLYRGGKAGLREVACQVRELWHTETGKSAVARWHHASLARDYPTPARLPFSDVLCIDEVYDRVGGRRTPIFTCVDPVAAITVRIPVERADAEHLAGAMEQVRALGAEPAVVVSDLWAAYPEALRRVWPRAERQLCWFHVMQWLTRQLAALLRDYGATLPEAERKELNRLRFRLLASPERQARLDDRGRAALARARELIRGTLVEAAFRLRDDLRAVLNDSTDRADARDRFARLRATWPAHLRPRTWRPGEPIPPPVAPPTEGPTGLAAYLEAIMAFFVAHFEALITSLGHPGVPRTNNHAERANRRYRAVATPRYGWATPAGLRAFLVTLQGFDSG